MVWNNYSLDSLVEARVNLLIMAVIVSPGWVLSYGRHFFTYHPASYLQL